MVSKGLMVFWGVVDFCLLAAGAISIAFSIIWRKQDLLMNMVVTNADLNAGLALGVFLLVTFLISIFAIVQRNHVTSGLVILNYVLIIDAIVVLVLGTRVWFFTLRERDNFFKIYKEQSDDTIRQIQNKFSCCGYFRADGVDPTDRVIVTNTTGTTDFCTPVQTDFIKFLDPAVNNNSKNFCVSGVTAFADYALNNIFSSMYGFMAIVLTLLVASLCVINQRKTDERFKRIDAKRGGKGFV
ncbi:tetraspanin [Dendrothele bispora CBS 962.96]|uniref:Tetraspanin n=1 Tax=Dendrothele bispora (strain CBS 962.96) TaxID=1314807 RepID=A0A4S8MXA9_DENBC|nr:tetraspanin [Dendrothele bispora CBS 962.96]